MKRNSNREYMREELDSISKDEIIEYLCNKYKNSIRESILKFYDSLSFGEAGKFYAKVAIIDKR
jgi:hypothetical protein